ncbi:MAG: PilZ domain-containing protein [Candidatus Omnitrophica bacterium]|nr:PilZ domain-containing protein [Candidatus Omnitrophota bacterium]
MPEEIFYYVSNANLSERRRFVRIGANFVVSYYVYPGHINRTDMSLTRNVSVGGICFTADKHFPPGTVLHVTLRLPKITETIEVLGEVVYIKQEKNKKFLFDIGVKFIQVKDEDLYLLERIIRSCASAGSKIHISIERKEKKSNESN